MSAQTGFHSMWRITEAPTAFPGKRHPGNEADDIAKAGFYREYSRRKTRI
jgi:hypothetical protein